MEKLSADLVLRVLLFLRPSEVTRMLSVDTRFFQVVHDQYLWRNLCTLSGTPSLHKSLYDEKLNNSYDSCRAYQLLARRLQACSEMSRVQWLKLQYADQNPGSILEKMEAHTATTFLNRFVVVVGGWCRANDNGVHVIDASVLCNNSDSDSDSASNGDTHHPLVTLATFTKNRPTFRYGFSTTEYQGRLLVLGGCQSGGYSHDCNNLYFVDLRFDRVDENGLKQSFYPNKLYSNGIPSEGNRTHSTDARQEREHGDPFADCAALKSHPSGTEYEVVARYTNNLTPHGTTALPISRGYHTAVVVHMDGRDCLLVWGGLHHRAPTTQLELCQLSAGDSHNDAHAAPPAMLWRAGHAQGVEPSPRFGHSCVSLSADDWLLPSVDNNTGKHQKEDVLIDRLVFTGGSNGNDLVRNGREIREIHILNIVRNNRASQSNRSSAGGGGDVLVWSTPRLTFVPAGVRPRQVIPGRCHCAVQVGQRVLFFGGSATSTNAVSVLSVPPPPTLPATLREDRSVHYVSAEQKVQLMVDELLHADIDIVNSEDDADPANPASPNGFTVHVPDVAPFFDVSKSRQVVPRPRLSAAAALVGRHWVVVGGFSVDHNQMGDVWALDLAYGTSDTYRADKEHFASEEGNKEEEEEEDDFESADEESVLMDEAPMGLLAFLQLLSGGGAATAPVAGTATAQDLQHTNIVAQLMQQGIISQFQASLLLNNFDGEDDSGESDLNQSSDASDDDEASGASEGESEDDGMGAGNL